MQTSDNIQRLLQQKIDQYKGVITPEILNRFSGEVMKEINQRSLPLAEGLSPEQLHQLLHFLFTERSIVRLNASIPGDVFCHCYITRTFHRGLMWLGMVETRETGNRMEGTHQEWVETTSLFHDLVKISLAPYKK